MKKAIPTNTESFLREITDLSNSGAGVFYVRTREPFRAIDAVRDFAATQSPALPFSEWDVVRGWRTHSENPESPPVVTNVLDPIAALKWIGDLGGTGDNAKTSGVFLMHGMHPFMKAPQIIQAFRLYVRMFACKRSMRLFIVNPEGERLPEELTHDIPQIDFNLPNAPEVEELFDYIIASASGEDETTGDFFSASEREMVIASAGGLTSMEAELAFSLAIVTNRTNYGNDITQIPFDVFNRTVLGQKTEVVKSSEVLELMQSTPMNEVGGLETLKEWIRETLPAFTPEAHAFGVDLPKGIAVIGPPGTGKTLVGKAIATSLGQPLVRFDVSKCFNSLVGASEERARSALKQLEAMGRVVVLFDEIDKALSGSHKSSGDSGVSSRVLGQILTFLQETKSPIFPIFTANRVGNLPPELLRKGRLDEVFAVMPPNKAERDAILRIHLGKRKQDMELDLTAAVQISRGYVSAELEAAVKESVKLAYVRKVELTGELIAEAIRGMKPLSEAFPEDFEAMSSWARNNAKLASLPDSETNDMLGEGYYVETDETEVFRQRGPGGKRRRRSIS